MAGIMKILSFAAALLLFGGQVVIVLSQNTSSNGSNIEALLQQQPGGSVPYLSAVLPDYQGPVRVMEAVIETTPSDCSFLYIVCGFHVYHKETGIPIETAIIYCRCPEGEECRLYGRKLSQHYYSYRCSVIGSPLLPIRDLTDDESDTTQTTTPMPSGELSWPDRTSA